MKNKFKKSKIIVPALALITATTAASVTGTVAWFTANRAVTVTASNFIATKLESNLTVTTAAGVGTATSNDNTGITTMTGTNSDTTNKLTHGSYDAQAEAAGSLYVAKVSDDGTAIDSFANLGIEEEAQEQGVSTTTNNWLARTDSTNKVNIWYGLSWTMTFKLDGATNNTKDYVLFDVAGSTFTSASGTTTAPGFRIAFMTADKFLVVGGDSVLTHCPATSSSSGWTYTSYTAGTNYVAITNSTAKASDESASATANSLSANYLNLGEVGTTDATALTVTCVAWYEGSDAYVADKYGETTIDMSTISASLNFYTRGIIA